ncbi:type I restriction endonuclease subunit R [Cryobacterium frigoriphilum]|uniref:Type I restriction endonuclease subunit R n=1 Tax=Cryobacterium frigoriphilum TaxID=1259150 RepID=A0A4R9A4L7_9MICO|nr:type I restriction endonuclease [Cryobacterium frigoriphilum]TFD52189.1 type I restriction endonuclease subunit R [Cryobacterium frigoriphilum]
MADHNEKPFEDELVNHLHAHGWLYSPTSAGYDKERALFPDDVFGWLEDTQPEVLARAVKPGDAASVQQKSRDALLDRLVKSLDAPFDSVNGVQGGTLSVLRRGFKATPLSFRMAQFKPVTALNPATTADYGKMRLRVMRQVFYSTSKTKSIDLVFFVNGLPVATLELKTDFTQNVQDAISQYRTHRNPKGEPLLSFGHRALVHFAVSNSEVFMTTHLRGPETFFLPFNQGNEGRAGNPPNPNGSATSYLWERVFQTDAWLGILGQFMHLQVEKNIDLVTGEVETKETLLFPRFQQWESVTKLIETARVEGPGHRYLVQHSAGSGKTNSIAWTAHQLSTLHRPDGSKVFNSVIVVTDRTVLDTQLQDAIKQIDAKTGVVVGIESGSGSKASRLAEALLHGVQIIVVTIQTFPFVMDELDKLTGTLAGRSYAIIADEAHSSQTGGTAKKLRQVLGASELADLADGGEVDAESVLAAEMESRANATNISYFAYTATPKAKTLELFGRSVDGSLPQAFHLYTMQQAIEEGFILDVLRNYTPYKVAFKLAHNGQEYDSEGPLVEKTQAVKELMQWVRLHDFNITQKVALIIEHYRENVGWRLNGKAKAMVVTGSRKEAVRYKLAFDDYLKRTGHTDVRALVAFSGEVLEPELSPEPYTEINMNPRLKGRSLPEAFKTDSFQVMLVANKFQTGFDQPLLVAMYVDKKLSGVTAVQTLSRLNRMAKGKDTTFVLDFVNDPEVIRDSFEPYFKDARLSAVTDPDIVHDMKAKLDSSGIYEEHEVEAAAMVKVLKKGNNALSAAVAPGRDRFNKRYGAAVLAGDALEVDKLELFRGDVTAFVNAYDFLSQVINYEETTIEKHAIYFRALKQVIRETTRRSPIDLAGVALIGYGIKKHDTLDIALTDEVELDPLSATGSGKPVDPAMTRLMEAVEQLNQLFDDDTFTKVDTMAFLTHVKGKAAENDKISTQISANSEQQFLSSPDLGSTVTDAIITSGTNFESMVAEALNSDSKLAKIIELIGRALYRDGREAA